MWTPRYVAIVSARRPPGSISLTAGSRSPSCCPVGRDVGGWSSATPDGTWPRRARTDGVDRHDPMRQGSSFRGLVCLPPVRSHCPRRHRRTARLARGGRRRADRPGVVRRRHRRARASVRVRTTSTGSGSEPRTAGPRGSLAVDGPVLHVLGWTAPCGPHPPSNSCFVDDLAVRAPTAAGSPFNRRSRHSDVAIRRRSEIGVLHGHSPVNVARPREQPRRPHVGVGPGHDGTLRAVGRQPRSGGDPRPRSTPDAWCCQTCDVGCRRALSWSDLDGRHRPLVARLEPPEPVEPVEPRGMASTLGPDARTYATSTQRLGTSAGSGGSGDPGPRRHPALHVTVAWGWHPGTWRSARSPVGRRRDLLGRHRARLWTSGRGRSGHRVLSSGNQECDRWSR